MSTPDPLGAGPLPRGLPESPQCPFCNGTKTELFNAFGSQASVSTYWCRPCRSPFEFMKWGARDAHRRNSPEADRS